MQTRHRFFTKAACALGGGILLGGAPLLFIAALHIGACLTPWLFLTAAPYFFMGAALGYSAGKAIIEPPQDSCQYYKQNLSFR